MTRPTTRPWHAATAQAVVLVAVLSVGGVHVVHARQDVAADRGSGPVVPVTAVKATVAPPVRLVIPKLRVSTRLVGLRKDATGRLQVPADPMRAGWYSQGPAPGDLGPAVLAGHVDSYSGPGVFVGLQRLAKGDEIDVRRADGTTAAFAVSAVRTYAKRRFPTADVYGSAPGVRALRLITCGGAFDRASRSYRSNVVVFAVPKPTVRKPTVRKPTGHRAPTTSPAAAARHAGAP